MASRFEGRFQGKVVIVAGGTSGIGAAVSRRIAAERGVVVIAGRRAELGEQLAGEIRDGGGEASFVAADVTVEVDVGQLVEETTSRFGRLDAAFNNAGGVVAGGPVAHVDAASWRAELDLNLTSVFHGLKYELPAIETSGGGAVVNNASMGGVVGTPGLAAYTAAKHGVVGLTRSAALEYAGRGVRVNALLTGNVDTPLYRSLLGVPADADLPGPAPNPTGREASPDEVAAFVAFLLSDESAFVTGAALAADGGSTAGPSVG